MFRIGGVSAAELATAYGTPLLVLDYEALDAAVDAFTAACAPHGIEIAYAAKALLLVALAKHLRHTALQLDVCSLGELATAERAGFPADRITMHGCGKTNEELEAAVAGRVERIVVDNLDELQRLAARASRASPVSLLLRINTGIEAHTHHFIRTAGPNSKFGFDPPSLAAAIDVLKNCAGLRFIGLHAHVGSQIFEPEAFAANAQALMERAAYCAGAGFASEIVVAGGGFGVPMNPERPEAIDLTATVRDLAEAVANEARRWDLSEPRIGIEPGRSIVAAAGTSLYSVMAVKRQFDRTYAIVDGGMFENPRPALYDAYHHIVAATERSGRTIEMTVCGRACENDELGTAKLPEDLQAGDLVAMCTTGAYTYSMASNYNRFFRPPVVAVRQGTHAPIARRETIDDVLDRDVDA